MTVMRWLLASRAAQWVAAGFAGILTLLAALSRAERRGARDARDQIEDDTDDHIIERHEESARTHRDVRRASDDALREQLRHDGLGPRPRD